MERFLLLETVVHFLDAFAIYLAKQIQTVFCQTQRLSPVIRGEGLCVGTSRIDSGTRGLIDPMGFRSRTRSRSLGNVCVEGERVPSKWLPVVNCR